MPYIKKLRLENFKKFKSLEIDLCSDINTIIGDNEAGKSSIIQALELVCSGSRSRVEGIGIESLLNRELVKNFEEDQSLNKTISDLPKLNIEIYLEKNENIPELEGKLNLSKINASGLSLIYEPNENLSQEIKLVLSQDPSNFPYEYYVVKFSTFSGEAYSSNNRYLRALLIDNSQINSEYANREYTKNFFRSQIDEVQRIKLKNEYRSHKNSFKQDKLSQITTDTSEFNFSLRSNSKSNLETDISLNQDGIPIEDRGKGHQCFIKTELVLNQNTNRSLDILFLEEPENHLSHSKMKLLISKISESHSKQIIIATHSSLISTRLDLRKAILLNSSNQKSLTLNGLTDETSKFFMKSPTNNILEFILSQKVILVEGDAEYILIEKLYESVAGNSPNKDGIHIISVGGLSFKRYLELAKILNIKVAVIRDNDGDIQKNCIENYADYSGSNINIFSDQDNLRTTFEICIYNDNKSFCDKLFTTSRIKLPPLDYMLKSKAEAAFRIIDSLDKNPLIRITTPKYIKQAIEWIKR